MENKPLIAYIIRKPVTKYTGSSEEAHIRSLDISKTILEDNGYDVIVGTTLDDIPYDKISKLDLLITHIGTEKGGKLGEQEKLKNFIDYNIKFVHVLSLTDQDKDGFADQPEFGRLEGEYYMKPLASLIDAVEYFLNN